MNENLQKGINAAKNGDYEKAVTNLIKTIQEEPQNEQGWLFLGHCLKDKEKRKYSYERVLKINPANEVAKISLRQLENSGEPKTKAEVETKQIAPPIDASPPKEKNKKIRLVALGLLTGILFFGLPALFFIKTGKLDKMLIEALPTNIPAEEFSTLTVSQDNTDTNMQIALALFDEKKYAEAIPYLDQIIEISPNNDMAYFYRARCYNFLNIDQRSNSAYIANIEQSIADIDKAIELNPKNARYYYFRRNRYEEYAYEQQFQVDVAYYMNIAVDNISKYRELADPTDELMKPSVRELAKVLTGAGRCEEALELVNDELSNTPSGDFIYLDLLNRRSHAYACLGDLEKADEDKRKMMSMENTVNVLGLQTRSLYLYQLGKKDEALNLINQSIEITPSFGGGRYYIRALIKLDKGDKEGAIQDLNTGVRYTWGRGAIYAYVNARLALLENDQEGAIYWLQIAEASADPEIPVLKKQIQEELKELGGEVLNLSVSVPFRPTPMPPTE